MQLTDYQRSLLKQLLLLCLWWGEGTLQSRRQLMRQSLCGPASSSWVWKLFCEISKSGISAMSESFSSPPLVSLYLFRNFSSKESSDQ